MECFELSRKPILIIVTTETPQINNELYLKDLQEAPKKHYNVQFICTSRCSSLDYLIIGLKIETSNETHKLLKALHDIYNFDEGEKLNMFLIVVWQKRRFEVLLQFEGGKDEV